ncbi:PHP domain-containing protein [Clostridium sp. SHJSY1]|uniref:PHP domain-containing protein n=1 Tax=Clostridium sp. SHJSY1 TaxID=2942483 RepID=UPI0028741D68|nr:PHP domain-containing protein [Clostridium sp. SHJSY1]MDS0528500.1 PHP domain-containing protein [Clostridium sp. SHJSY1]
MGDRIDLHTHSNISDGSCNPKELIEVALKENIKAIALTDHDNIGGIEEAYIAAREKNIDFLAGIEISSLYKNGRIIHILGLGIDLKNEEFLSAYNEMKMSRDKGVKDIISKIKSQGIHISIDDLRKKSKGEYLDRYDIYRYFLENKLCNSAQEIWDKYLDPIPYGDKELIKAEGAIRIIKEAGGLSFLAHYNKSIGFSGLSNEEIEEEIKYLISLGLDGIERYYPSFNKVDYEFLDYLIEKYNLMISGGTDYHGKNRAEIEIGRGKSNNLFIPYDVYTKINGVWNKDSEDECLTEIQFPVRKI